MREKFEDGLAQVIIDTLAVACAIPVAPGSGASPPVISQEPERVVLSINYPDATDPQQWLSEELKVALGRVKINTG